MDEIKRRLRYAAALAIVAPIYVAAYVATAFILVLALIAGTIDAHRPKRKDRP
jgi:hypothetical protein